MPNDTTLPHIHCPFSPVSAACKTSFAGSLLPGHLSWLLLSRSVPESTNLYTKIIKMLSLAHIYALVIDCCRGTVIGVLKSFLGLSGSFFTTIYVSFLEPDAASFLLLLAIVPSAIVLACTLVINFVPYIQVEPHTKVCAGGDAPNQITE